MSSSGIFSTSPAMVLPPQQHVPDQYFHDAHYRSAQDATSPNGLPTPTRSMPPTPSEGAIAGRKRSRGDIYSPEDENLDGSMAMQSAPTLPLNLGEPTYGPGKTLVYPKDQSGHYSPEAEVPTQSVRPVMATRKSQRLDSGLSRADDLPPLCQMPRCAGTEPLIDEASRMLGISWSRMDATENSQVSQRAYTRWVSRHYSSLSNVELWFENSAIPGYLGKATNNENGLEEYYLWSYDLHQAILVTRNPGDLVVKLSSPHMSLSQATDRIHADIEPVVEASAANAAILHNDRFIIDDEQIPGGMEVD